jgi:hypothetical protein
MPDGALARIPHRRIVLLDRADTFARMANSPKKSATTKPSKPSGKSNGAKKSATTTPAKKPSKTAGAKKSATTSPAPAAPAKTTAATRGEDAPIAVAAGALLAAWPPISDVERGAFQSRAPDAVCDALGTRTKSAGVARDALAFAKIIDATLRATPTLVRPYSPARFAWFLECLVGLLDARAAAAADTKKASTTRDGASALEATARAVRNDLLAILEDLAGEADDDRAALDAARGGSTSRAEIAASLASLADLAAGWLACHDASSRALVAASGRQQGDGDRARAASATLVSASSGAALGGRVDPRDTAAVNRVEGRVLFEMRAAMSAFSNAHARDKSVPKLSPGAATRHALTPGKAAAAATEPANAPTAPTTTV